MADARPTKYDAYIGFLESITTHLEKDKDAMDKRISLYQSVLCIMNDKKQGKKITKARYKKLTAFSCPDFGMVAALEGVPLEKAAELFPNCSSVKDCSTCWEEFLDMVVDTVNDSEHAIKNSSPLPSPTEDKKED